MAKEDGLNGAVYWNIKSDSVFGFRDIDFDVSQDIELLNGNIFNSDIANDTNFYTMYMSFAYYERTTIV